MHPKSMILQTGGFAFGDISTKSSPASSANSRPLLGDTNPTLLPSAPIKRISVANIASFIRGPVSRTGGALCGRRAMA